MMIIMMMVMITELGGHVSVISALCIELAT